MKKVLLLASLIVLVANSAFAGALATFTPSTPAAAIYGGVIGSAATAPTALIKFSTGVRGLVNFSDNTAYLIATKHDTGSKVFGTCNSVTNIYWRQVTAGAMTTAMLAGISSGSTLAAGFVGNGWTSY